jgi:hypothetical protein
VAAAEAAHQSIQAERTAAIEAEKNAEVRVHEGRIQLSPAAARRATTPLGHDGRPGLPAPQSFAGHRLQAVQQYFEALCRDADATRQV